MFLPFLPLILASAGLTLFAGELERTEPWLNLPLAVNLSLIILFSFLLAQMPQWIWQFSKLISRSSGSGHLFSKLACCMGLKKSCRFLQTGVLYLNCYAV